MPCQCYVRVVFWLDARAASFTVMCGRTYHGEILVRHVVVDSNPGGCAWENVQRRARRCAVDNNILPSLATRVDLGSCNPEDMVWREGRIVDDQVGQGGGRKAAPQGQDGQYASHLGQMA